MNPGSCAWQTDALTTYAKGAAPPVPVIVLFLHINLIFVVLVYAELWVQRNGVEDSLPGLPFNNRQMFWIHKARSWCQKRREDSLRNLILTGTQLTTTITYIPVYRRQYLSADFHCIV